MAVFSRPGVDLAYRMAGRGEPLVLIHGMGSSGADWAFQAAHLARRFRLVVPDLRGSGLTRSDTTHFSVPEFADDIWQLLDHLRLPRAGLLGFSLGGAVATEMALQRPHAVSRLMTINSLPSYRIDTWRKWVEVHGQMGLVRCLGLPRTARLVARRMFPHPHQAGMRDRVVDVLGRAAARPYLATARALAGWTAMERSALLTMPMLMLAAENDYTPMQEKREFAARLGAELAIVRDSRHGTPFDAIEATNLAAEAFFLGQPLPHESLLRGDDPERVPDGAPPGIEADDFGLGHFAESVEAHLESAVS
jgi:3-oxoadipate enol-lactonase